MDQRKEFVLQALDPLCKFTRLCCKYGITTETGYKWKIRKYRCAVARICF